MRIENRNASDDRPVGQPEQRSVIPADAPVPSLFYLSDKLASGNSGVVPTPSVMVTLSPETRKDRSGRCGARRISSFLGLYAERLHSPFHGGNTGSNPVGDAIRNNNLCNK
jgi:hypothetical protein